MIGHGIEVTILFVLRWTARILSLATVLLLILFYLGEGLNFGNIELREYIGLLFFPVGLVVGFAVGWHKELLGGIISSTSIAGFYLIYGVLLNGSIMQGSAFLVFAIPGFLFLLYGLVARIDYMVHHHTFSHR